MYAGRLKRRMWFDTAQRLRYTLTRFHGERFEVEACTRHEWNRIIEPAGPLGGTRQPRATSFVIVSWSMVRSGWLVVVVSCKVSRSRVLWGHGLTSRSS